MTHIEGNPGEIHELARYEVRAEALDEVLAAVHEFVAYVRANEAGALRYEVWQERERPTRFVHLFVWRDEEANRIHAQSVMRHPDLTGVRRFVLVTRDAQSLYEPFMFKSPSNSGQYMEIFRPTIYKKGPT
jgi:quinol monooxygenase YgiN